MTVFDFFKTRLRQAREWLLDYAYWVTLGAMIAVIVGTALYTDRLRQAENVQAAAPAPEVASPSPRRPPTRRRCRRSRPSAFRPLWVRFAPFPAGCFAAFPRSPCFWPSLDCWQAHPAVDLGAASGENRRLHARRRGALLRAG